MFNNSPSKSREGEVPQKTGKTSEERGGEGGKTSGFMLPTSVALGALGVVGAIGVGGLFMALRRPQTEPDIPAYFNQPTLRSSSSTATVVETPRHWAQSSPVTGKDLGNGMGRGVMGQTSPPSFPTALPAPTAASRRGAWVFALTTLGLGTALALTSAAVLSSAVGWALGVRDVSMRACVWECGGYMMELKGFLCSSYP